MQLPPDRADHATARRGDPRSQPYVDTARPAARRRPSPPSPDRSARRRPRLGGSGASGRHRSRLAHSSRRQRGARAHRCRVPTAAGYHDRVPSGPEIDVPNGPRGVRPMASLKGPFGNGPGIPWGRQWTKTEGILEEERDTTMTVRLRSLGVVLAVFGLAFLAGGAYTFYRTQEGARSLQAFSAAQQIKLSYNEQGQLVDRGKT